MIASSVAPFGMSRTAPVSPRRDAAVVARMADFMIHHTAGDGSVTRADLLLDFTDEQIDIHFEAAKALARKGVAKEQEQLARSRGKARS